MKALKDAVFLLIAAAIILPTPTLLLGWVAERTVWESLARLERLAGF